MKRILKITIILVMMLMIQFQINYCYAARESSNPGLLEDTASGVPVEKITTDSSSASSIMDNPENYLPKKESFGDLIGKASRIVIVIRNIGIVVAVIALMVIGFRTLTASTEERAAYKQSLPGYILGIIMVVAITLLPTLIYNIVQNW